MLFKLLEQGGPIFMAPILLIFILCTVMFVRELLQKNNKEKTSKLLISISVFVLVWGLCGQILGLIEGFDALGDVQGSVAPAMLYGGLKFTFLPTLFGMVAFLFARLYVIVLQWLPSK